jgi:hypothetical protein
VTIEIGDSKKIAYKLTNDKKLVDAMYTLKKNPEKLSHPIGLRSMIRFVKVQKQLGTKFAIEEFCAKFTADEAIDIKKALTVLIPRTEQTTMVEDEDKEDKDWTDDDTNPGDDGEKDDDEDEDDE